MAALKLTLVCLNPSAQQQPGNRPVWQKLQCVWVLSALLEFVAHRMLCTWNGGPAYFSVAFRAAGENENAARVQQAMPARGDGALVLASYHALQTRLHLHVMLAAAQRQEQAARQPATSASYALYFAYEQCTLLLCITAL